MKRFGRYLLGRTPSTELQARYAEALRLLSNRELETSAALRLATRRPWMLPFLDAACGWVRPRDPLRRRLLLAAAILEATPEHAHDFLPQQRSRAAILLLLAWKGLTASGKLVVGMLLLKLCCREPRVDLFTPSPREGRR